MSSKTHWLTRAVVGCPICSGKGTIYNTLVSSPGQPSSWVDEFPCPECHRTATLLEQVWDESHNLTLAAMADEGDRENWLKGWRAGINAGLVAIEEDPNEYPAIAALRERGPNANV